MGAASLIVPPNVDVPLPAYVSVADPVLLVMIWLAGTAPGATAKPLTAWLLLARSSVPLLASAPKVTVPLGDKPLLTPRMTEPPWMFVPPV